MTQETVDGTEDSFIVRCEQATVDDCYDLRMEAEAIGLDGMVARIQIEIDNMHTYDGYVPSFTDQELFHVGVMLMNAREMRQQTQDQNRVETIRQLANLFIDELDIDEEEIAQMTDEVENGN